MSTTQVMPGGAAAVPPQHVSPPWSLPAVAGFVTAVIGNMLIAVALATMRSDPGDRPALLFVTGAAIVVVGLPLSFVGLHRTRRRAHRGGGLAIAGLALGLSVVSYVALSVVGMAFVSLLWVVAAGLI